MCKKLFVFSLAFCLGLISIEIISQYKTNSVENYSQQLNLSGGEQCISSPSLEKAIKRLLLDEEIRDFYLKFQKAVAENDRQTVASLLNYPLRVNFPTDKLEKKHSLINNQKSFLKVYDRIFDDKLKNFIARIDAENDEDFIDRWDGVGVGRGVIWMEIFCFKRNCEDNKRYFKIRTIHGNSELMDLD